ncbi:MAG: GntR family transcriptional regulator [Cyclobacteriaceae bacterium]|nr:GntR family transcriptional regulator [Cyclobacteriaceae bacterium]
MKIGEHNSLKVLRDTPHGIFLADEEGEVVLLPGKYLSGDEKEGDVKEVFIYNDSEDRLVATTETPKILLNEFAALKVIDVNKNGVFLDWGLEKDLLVPFKEQNKKMQLGQTYVVRMYLDEDTDRLVATAKLKKYLSNEELTIKPGDEVDLMVFNQSDLGYEMIIDQQHVGLVYRNEVFSPVNIGDKLTGYIKQIRNDGKIDVSLQPDSATHIEKSNEVIIRALKSNDGVLNLSDKSSPEDIYAALNMSKKTFKKAIGNLYKQRKITIRSGQISFVK